MAAHFAVSFQANTSDVHAHGDWPVQITSGRRGSASRLHLSRCQSRAADEYARMNMPFELGLDLGIRRSADNLPSPKKFLIFERRPYELKRTLSDLAGQDVDAHHEDYQEVMRKTRDFLKVEAERSLPGTARIVADYETFQAWMIEKKLGEGHSERDAMRLPTSERLEEMRAWMAEGKPVS
ncbi:hypothetical protein [Paracoccus sp. 22332]|uniref:hypothetical protein n=1 Tax=Paracoccus sp. 22332 TaxID=3453913 RepID=UPI003F8672B4